MEHTEQTHRQSIEIKNRVEELRRKCGLSQKQLADAVGLNHRTVGYIEHQDYTPSLELAYRLGDLFKMEPYEVFYRCSHDESEPLAAVRSEPPSAVQDLAGGKARARILVTLFDYSDADKLLIEKITKVPPEDLAEHLTALQQSNLVRKETVPGVFLGWRARAVFRLSVEARASLTDAFRSISSGDAIEAESAP